jgi:hypothetical protein
VAERVAGEILNLPTDQEPDSREQHAVDALLDACVDQVL